MFLNHISISCCAPKQKAWASIGAKVVDKRLPTTFDCARIAVDFGGGEQRVNDAKLIKLCDAVVAVHKLKSYCRQLSKICSKSCLFSELWLNSRVALLQLLELPAKWQCNNCKSKTTLKATYSEFPSRAKLPCTRRAFACWLWRR